MVKADNVLRDRTVLLVIAAIVSAALCVAGCDRGTAGKPQLKWVNLLTYDMDAWNLEARKAVNKACSKGPSVGRAAPGLHSREGAEGMADALLEHPAPWGAVEGEPGHGCDQDHREGVQRLHDGVRRP